MSKPTKAELLARNEELARQIDVLCNNALKRCFILVAFGEWTRGATAYEAFSKMFKSASGPFCLYLVIGDNTAEINGSGHIIRNAGSQLIQLAKFRTLPKSIEEFVY